MQILKINTFSKLIKPLQNFIQLVLHNMPNDFRPRFHNPVPLPSIDDFRLSTILLKHVNEENEAVKKALLNVTERHQDDLKQEIRRLLTVEQKIQYLNIDVAKRAHLLRRKVASRKRRLEKAIEGLKNDKDGSLYADIRELMTLAVLVSAQVQGLANLALEYERSKNGPLSGPDPHKYPRLASFFGTGTESVDVDSTESEVVDGYIDNRDHQLHHRDSHESHFDDSFDSVSNGFQTAFSEPAFPKNTTGDGSNSGDLSPDDNELGASSSEEEQSAPPSPKTAEAELVKEPSPEEVTAEMFEQIMDMNISKYRLQRQRKYDELDLFGPQVTLAHPSTAPKNKSNPLRLLYSSLALANSDMLKARTVEAESLKSPFVNSKSVATVLPTPQTSLHKKLRIRVQPLRYNKKNDNCCQESEREGETNIDSSPAKEALTKTLNNFLDSAIAEDQDNELDDDVWNSSAYQTDTDEEATSSSEDTESQEASVDNPLDISAEDYQSFRKDLAKARTKKSQRSVIESPMREFSPTPKHQPSHRTLKPKGSILKISNGTRRKNKATSFLRSQSRNCITLVNGLPLKASSPLPESAAHTPYRASPRASFVNEVSALGMILGSEPPRAEESEDENRDNSIEDEESLDNESAKSDNRDGGDYKSIDRLRSLLV